MGCRAQFWTLIGAIALLWICGGIYSVIVSPSLPNSSTDTKGTGVAIFFCTGVPVLLIASSLANGARRSYREEQRHNELLATQQAQTATMQQMAAMQMAQMQQSQAAATPTADVKSQLEAAKALIQAKQYTQARNLLKTINHPRAGEWLAKLDEMKV